MERVTLQALDISCGHCIQSIERAVSKLPGVQFVSGDPEVQSVILEYDPMQTPLSTIEEAMNEEGYPVKK